MVVDSLCFSKPKQRFDRIQFCPRLFPEIQWHQVGHIAAESIDIAFIYPELHCFDHVMPHLVVVIIEVNHIVPAVLVVEFSLCVACVVLRMLLCPPMIETRMIGYPVDDDLEAEYMCF